MQKAILEIIPEDPTKYFNLETNGLNKVQIADGMRACLQALTDDIYSMAVEAGCTTPVEIQQWIHSQRTEHIKAQVIDQKQN